MKLIYHTNAYYSLTNFEYQVNKMNGNINYVKMLKFASKIREITSGEFIFGRFQQFETTLGRPELTCVLVEPKLV